MKPRPDLLAGTANPSARAEVVIPPHLVAGIAQLPKAARYEIDGTGEKAELVLDLSKCTRTTRRKALRKFKRLGWEQTNVRRKLPSKRKQLVDEKEEAMALEILGHKWATGKGGRSIDRVRRGNNLLVVAAVTCTAPDCGSVGEIKSRTVLPPEVLDKRMKQKGWRLDPPVCPDCVQRPKEETVSEQTTVPTPSEKAVHAQAKVFRLLSTHFDVESGRYGSQYSDQRIATETGCAIAFVQQIRKECFGELKEHPELAQLRADIQALEQLANEGLATLKAQLDSELAQLKYKLARVQQ